MRKLSFVIGALLFLVGLYLAIFEKYNHYYEPMILGMLLAINSLLGKQDYYKLGYLYLILIPAGIIGDLIMGIWATNLWTYAYTSPLEYIVLYTFLYPVAGLLMVQTYLLVSKYLNSNAVETRSVSRYILAGSALFSLGGGMLFIPILVGAGSAISRLAFFTFTSMFAFFALELFSSYFSKISFINSLYRNPKSVFIAIFIATYSNFVIHEGTNYLANQWVYNTDGLDGLILFGHVSLPAFILWPLLLLLPLAAYYTISDRNPFYKGYLTFFYK